MTEAERILNSSATGGLLGGALGLRFGGPTGGIVGCIAGAAVGLVVGLVTEDLEIDEDDALQGVATEDSKTEEESWQRK